MRRIALALLSAGCLLAEAPALRAQPAPLTIVAPSPSGSGWDHVAHALAAGLADRVPPVGAAVANVPGGSGTVGLNKYLSGQAEAELLVTGLTMLEATLAGRSVGKVSQLTPIARLVQEPYGIIVPTSSAVASIADLRSALLADPSRVSWAGGPIGGVDHVAAILLYQAVGLEAQQLNYVPFLTSSDAAAAAADSRIGVALLPLGELAAGVKAGTVRLLAVTCPTAKVVPEVPVLQAAGIPFSFANWRGVAGKAGLAREEQARLTGLVEQAVGTRGWSEQIGERYWDAAFLPGDGFGKFIQQEQARLKSALLAAGILKRPVD